jgi:hypothetical protein
MSSSEPKESTVRKDGYEVTFYEGFASRIVVREADGTAHELYRQSGVYRLPTGRKKPDTRHVLRLKGGGKKQDITLDIDDPELRIARITVELYPHDVHAEGADPSAESTSDTETIEVENNPKLCPPHCSDD